MAKILKLNKISNVFTSDLPKDYVVSDNVQNPDGIVVRSFKMHEYPLEDSLLCVARAGAGTNNIPIDKCSQKGIVVFNTPGANANAVKELVICSMFLCGRKIYEGINWAGTLTENAAKAVEDGKSSFVGCEILGKTLAIVGLGAIGILVANAAAALGMKVVGYDPFFSDEKAAMLASGVSVESDLIKTLENADFVSLHLPYNDSTKKMFNEALFAKMKDGVNVINCARGELVDNDYIKVALKNGKVNKYVTDFPNEEVIGVENIITIPHLGASTPEAEENCAIMAAAQMTDFLENGNIKNSVNFPALSMQRAAKVRVTALYNADDVLEAVKAANPIKLAQAKRGNLSYLIADFDAEPANLQNTLNSTNGILKVRII